MTMNCPQHILLTGCSCLLKALGCLRVGPSGCVLCLGVYALPLLPHLPNCEKGHAQLQVGQEHCDMVTARQEKGAPAVPANQD